MADAAKPRWYRLTPDRLVLGLLIVEVFLPLAERLGCFTFHEHEGWIAAISIAALAGLMLVMLLWFAIALIFRRPFQYSLRSLLVLTVAVAIPCSRLAVERERVGKQRDAVKALQRFQGSIEYDYERAFNRRHTRASPWLHSWLGDDWFAQVQFVCLGGGDEFTDTEMARLESFPRLKFLNLECPNITDAGMKHLKTLTQLESLHLMSEMITDEGLEHIRGLTKLRKLSLSHSQVTDAGLKNLEGLAHLRELQLLDTHVTDTGVKKLQQALPHCKIER